MTDSELSSFFVYQNTLFSFSVVFAGFSAEALRDRIADSELTSHPGTPRGYPRRSMFVPPGTPRGYRK